MPNLIDKLISKVNTVRQKAADKFGLPAHNMYRVLRSWSGNEIGVGTPTDLETLITPTPKIEFTGKIELTQFGLEDKRKMKASEISLTFQENFLQGDPKLPGQECFYKLVERNGQGADTTYWTLINIPLVEREEINWVLEFGPATVCS
jgi:hypothetical protein